MTESTEHKPGETGNTETAPVTLKGIRVYATTSSEDLDNDSKVSFGLSSYGKTIAEQYWKGIQRSDGELLELELVMRDNTFLRDDMSKSYFVMTLTANGRDQYTGNLDVTFRFSDGKEISWPFGPFRLGTHDGWGHDTHKDVNLDGLPLKDTPK